MGANLKKPSTIAKMKRHYLKIAENSKDPVERRVAYAMELALRWATEKTSGWDMRAEPIFVAALIRIDIDDEVSQLKKRIQELDPYGRGVVKPSGTAPRQPRRN